MWISRFAIIHITEIKKIDLYNQFEIRDLASVSTRCSSDTFALRTTRASSGNFGKVSEFKLVEEIYFLDFM